MIYCKVLRLDALPRQFFTLVYLFRWEMYFGCRISRLFILSRPPSLYNIKHVLTGIELEINIVLCYKWENHGALRNQYHISLVCLMLEGQKERICRCCVSVCHQKISNTRYHYYILSLFCVGAGVSTKEEDAIIPLRFELANIGITLEM